MIKQVKDQKDIDNVILQEYIKASVNCIDINDSVKMTIRISKPNDIVEIQTITNDEKFIVCDDKRIDIQVENYFLKTQAHQQLEWIYIIFGINYFNEIREAINNDEYVHYDVERLYLRKLFREHTAKYYQYVVRASAEECQKHLNSNEWKELKKSLLES